MIRALAAVLLGAALIAPAPVQADDTGEILSCLQDAVRGEDCIGQVSKSCMQSRADGETTVGMETCISAETAAWDAVLNTTYRSLMAQAGAADATGDVLSSDHTRADTLKAAQRAWIGFRDAECLMQKARYGKGSLGGVAAANCLMDETAFRVLALRGLADG